jgi:hypothetical protein
VKRFIFIVPVLLACLGVPSRAQNTAQKAGEAVPSAQDVVAHYVKAVGGEEAWRKIHSRVCKGTIEFTDVGLKGTVELDEKAPDKVMLAASVAILGDFRRGYDGTIGWAEDPQSGFRKMAGTELAETRREAEFYMPLRLMDIYPQMKVTGEQTIDGKEAWEIAAVAPDGAQRTFDFDTRTGYLLRVTGEEDSGAGPGKDHVELFLEDYKEFNGVSLPTTHRQTSPAALVMVFTDVKQNVPVADSVFAPPAGK